MCVYFTLNVMASGSWLQKRAVYSCKSLFFSFFLIAADQLYALITSLKAVSVREKKKRSSFHSSCRLIPSSLFSRSRFASLHIPFICYRCSSRIPQ